MPAPIVHLNGQPGTGKFTIAKSLTELMPGARLLDNHCLLDPVRALFAREMPEMEALREKIRDVVFLAAQDVADDLPIVLTDALDDSDLSARIFAPVATFANASGRPLYRFNLDIEEEENLRRLTASDRTGRFKLRDPHVLLKSRAEVRLLGWGNPAIHCLDVSTLSAEEAARRILSTLQGAA